MTQPSAEIKRGIAGAFAHRFRGGSLQTRLWVHSVPLILERFHPSRGAETTRRAPRLFDALADPCVKTCTYAQPCNRHGICELKPAFSSARALPMDEPREGAPPEACDEIAGAILRYLHAHPHAADTFSGIARWWLARESGPVSTSALECALQRLVAGGQVARELLGDGACIFRRGPALGGENGTEPS